MKQAEIFSKILHYVELDSELDHFDKIHETIQKDMVFKGTNLWILAFAIIIASVGLNVNSTAVIIGAMLISPLMGPINGMGYSIATYNMALFIQAVKNFSFAVAASLIASTTYFFISPISTAHSELLARTSPTIYDVIIALFGGLAGIVAISSKQKGNIIPGVAIATALMPPLCTAGYGLATFQFNYFFGAFFLFTINTVFIALSSVIISQILKFPIRTIVDAAQRKRINKLISIIILLVLIPSIYFGYLLVQQEKFIERATKFIATIGIIEHNILLKHEINPTQKTISLLYGGVSLTDDQKKNIEERAYLFSLKDAKIEFQQEFSFDPNQRRMKEVESLSSEVQRLSYSLKEKESEILELTKEKEFGNQLSNELKILFPQIESCIFSESEIFNSGKSLTSKAHTFVLSLGEKKLSSKDKIKIESWLKTRLGSENVKLIIEN